MTIRTLLLGFLIGIFTSSAVVYAAYDEMGRRWGLKRWQEFVQQHPEEANDPAGALFDCQLKLTEKKDL